jgi:hypothetical protein
MCEQTGNVDEAENMRKCLNLCIRILGEQAPEKKPEPPKPAAPPVPVRGAPQPTKIPPPASPEIFQFLLMSGLNYQDAALVGSYMNAIGFEIVSCRQLFMMEPADMEEILKPLPVAKRRMMINHMNEVLKPFQPKKDEKK